MNQVMKIKVIRFLLNFVIYAGFLSTATLYVYTQPPGFYTIKNILLPIEAALFCSIVFSLILSGLNEIMSMMIIKRFGSNKK